MIIQCPSCSTNFFLDEKKFNGSPKKLKCSRCSLIWTSSSKGEPIDVPKLFEPSSTQGLKTNDKNQEKIYKSNEKVVPNAKGGYEKTPSFLLFLLNGNKK